MKKNKIKLSDIFNLNAVNDGYGIFEKLGSEDGGGNPYYPLLRPFIDSNTNTSYLDFDYEVGFSADKIISPLFEKLWIQALQNCGFTIDEFLSGEMDDADIETCITNLYSAYPFAELIYNRFGVKWNKIYQSLVASVYNPLENYNMEETRTPDLATGLTASAENKSGVFGFNGTSAKDSTTNDGSSSSTTTLTGTDTTTKKGFQTNYGVNGQQQLIEQELELRKHDFYRMIYMDIDSILCLKIY